MSGVQSNCIKGWLNTTLWLFAWSTENAMDYTLEQGPLVKQ